MRKQRKNVMWLRELDHIITQNLSDVHLSSTALAYKMSISQRTFFRKVKEITNQTPNEYINRIRFQKAYEYLENEDFDTMAQIAYAVGFKDSSYFSRKFKERFGMSPFEV